MPLAEYIREGPDPLNVAVHLEDGVAVLGVGVAAACIGLTAWTGDATYDAVGSIVVGLTLGGVAVMLVSKNRTYLLGPNIKPAKAKMVPGARRGPPATARRAPLLPIWTPPTNASGRPRVVIARPPRTTQVLALLNNDPSVASVHGMKATMVRRPSLHHIFYDIYHRSLFPTLHHARLSRPYLPAGQ